MDTTSFTIYVLVTLALLVLTGELLRKRTLDNIPTVGYSSPLLSFFTAIRGFWATREIIQLGYDKYPGRAFKYATLDRWIIVVNGPKLLDDLRRATGDTISFTHMVAEAFQLKYTLAPNVISNPYHINVVRTPLTRNINAKFLDILEEVKLAFDRVIHCDGKDWKGLPALDTMVDVVCQVSSRIFVGAPLCRNEDYRSLIAQVPTEIIKGRTLIYLPSFLRPFGARLFTSMPKIIERIGELLGPILQHRLEQERQYGRDWPDKPNDVLTWVLEEATEDERSLRNIVIRVVLINFAAIHTTSMIFTHALFEIAASPRYIAPLREEIKKVSREVGWSKESVSKMTKMDSVFRETLRYYGISSLLGKWSVKDLTLSDGTFVPKGNVLALNIWPTHHDAAIYPEPDTFDGFRFLNEECTEQPLMVTPSLDYLGFGQGRTVCPGRFLAAVELKLMLAHVLTKYDIELENPGVRPANFLFEGTMLPNRTAKIFFKRRTSS